MSLSTVVAAVLGVASVLYLLTGGADFGGGVLDLTARGSGASERRRAIERAIAPIWEANHVWLILILVLLFVCFPPAHAAISTALHIPLTLLLLGIVLRGSAFVFRQYGKGADAEKARWGRVFALSSLFTPFMIGVCFGALLTGEIVVEDGVIASGFFAGWTQPIAWAVGGLVVAQSTFLAAVYLSNETDGEIQEGFRQSALRWGVLTGLFAALALGLAALTGDRLAETLLSPRALPFHVATGLLAVAALAALVRRRLAPARILAVLQITLVVGGGAVSLFPYIIPGSLTFEGTASPDSVLRGTLVVLAAGAVLLIPAFAWLMWIFKGDVLLRSRGAANDLSGDSA